MCKLNRKPTNPKQNLEKDYQRSRGYGKLRSKDLRTSMEEMPFRSGGFKQANDKGKTLPPIYNSLQDNRSKSQAVLETR